MTHKSQKVSFTINHHFVHYEFCLFPVQKEAERPAQRKTRVEYKCFSSCSAFFYTAGKWQQKATVAQMCACKAVSSPNATMSGP